jgi:hypothetical protein
MLPPLGTEGYFLESGFFSTKRREFKGWGDGENRCTKASNSRKACNSREESNSRDESNSMNANNTRDANNSRETSIRN